MITPEQLVDQARQWLGVRYRHQGRTRFGADCLGFISGVLAELGSMRAIEVLPLNYGRAPRGELLDVLSKNCRQIELQPGALILFRWPNTQDPSHAGIFTGENVIHADQLLGRVVEHGYRAVWVKLTISTWALPEVVYR